MKIISAPNLMYAKPREPSLSGSFTPTIIVIFALVRFQDLESAKKNEVPYFVLYVKNITSHTSSSLTMTPSTMRQEFSLSQCTSSAWRASPVGIARSTNSRRHQILDHDNLPCCNLAEDHQRHATTPRVPPRQGVPFSCDAPRGTA